MGKLQEQRRAARVTNRADESCFESLESSKTIFKLFVGLACLMISLTLGTNVQACGLGIRQVVGMREKEQESRERCREVGVEAGVNNEADAVAILC